MAGITSQRLRGVNEVGEVTGGPGGTDTTWGRTQQSGARLQVAVSQEQLFSAQSRMAEDSVITQAAMSIVFNLIFSELSKLQMVYGIPAAQFAGDLSIATPTPEILTIDEDSIGMDTKTVYVLTPGPASTRRLEAANCQLGDIGDIEFARNAWQLPSITYNVLNTADGTAVVVITDAV